MHVFVVPIYLYFIPFLLLGFLLKCVNWIIKKGIGFRPLALVLTLAVGGLWVLGGILLYTSVGIIFFSIDLVLSGALFLIIGCVHTLFVSRQKIIDGEIEEKEAEERSKIEEANYQSYDWIIQESKTILNSGKINDSLKLNRLLDVLNANRKYDEFKQLSKGLQALQDKENEEISKRIQESRKGSY
jgi:hypothetical protein